MSHHHDGFVAAIACQQFLKLIELTFRTQGHVNLNSSFKSQFVGGERGGLQGPLQRAADDLVQLNVQVG